MLWLDPDETAYAAHITVWTRWFLWIGAMISLALRPTFTFPQSIPQSIPFLILPCGAGHPQWLGALPSTLPAQGDMASRVRPQCLGHNFRHGPLSSMEVTTLSGSLPTMPPLPPLPLSSPPLY